MTDMGIATGVMLIILGVYALLFAALIAVYIMNSLSFYTIARRRQIDNAWLAWIPYGNAWIIGSIADDYDKRLGFKRKWRVLMLTLLIIIEAVAIVLVAAIIIFAIMMVMVSENGEPPESYVIGLVVVAYAFILLIAIAAVAQQAVLAICLYKIYESTVPEKAVKYLLLTYLVPFAQSVCLLKCRNKGYENPPKFFPYGMNLYPVSEQTEPVINNASDDSCDATSPEEGE